VTSGSPIHKIVVGRRTVGAIAGLAPALAIVGYYLATGGEIMAGIGVIVVVAIAAGWIVGPMATGPLRSDLVAMAAYFLVGYLLNLVVGVVTAIWREVPSSQAGDPVGIGAAVTQTLLPGLIYLPVFAVFLTPVAFLWIVIVRLLRGRSSTTREA
jgi:hypothetical protein